MLQPIKIIIILFFVTGLLFINSSVQAQQASQAEINKYIQNFNNYDLASSAMRNLVRIGKPAVPALIQAAKNGGNFTSYFATSTLISIGVDAVPDLIPLLREKSNFFAIRILTKIGKSAVPALVSALKNNTDNNLKMYYGASEVLTNIGSDAVPELTRALQTDNLKALDFINFTIAGIGTKASVAVPGLLKNLQHLERDIRFSTIVALGAIRGGAISAVPALVNALKDKEPLVRFPAANALSEISRDINLSSYTSVALSTLIQMLPSGPNAVAPLLGDIGSDAISAVPILNKLYLSDYINRYYFIQHNKILESLQKIAFSTSNKVELLSNSELNEAILYFSATMELKEVRKFYSLAKEFTSIQASLSILKKEYVERSAQKLLKLNIIR